MLSRGVTIVFLDQYGELGGAQLCLLDLLPAVAERGWRAVVAAPAEGPLLDRCRAAGAAVEEIRLRTNPAPRFALDSAAAARCIARLLTSIRADLLYINGPRAVPAGVWAAGGRCRVVFHCHSVFPRATPIVGRLLRRARAVVIASSAFVLRPLTRYVGGHVVYNGVTDLARPRQPAAAPRIGVIGRISPEKGQLEFVEAARRLAPKLPAARFTICGAPQFSDPAYQQLVRRRAAGLPIDFLDWQEDVARVLAALDVLVVPSTGPESTTRVIPEAFSAGVAVVAARTGGIPEVVDDGVTGVLVGNGSPEQLAAAIHRLAAAPADRTRGMVAAGRAQYERRFTVERYRREVLALL